MTTQHLLAAHHFFDLSLKQWQDFVEKHPEKNPFKEKIFTPWKSKKQIPRDWNEAIDWSSIANEKYYRASYFDEKYPAVLKEIPAPPPVIYWMGAELVQSISLVSIIGTRKPSVFGYVNACEFSKKIAAEKIGIVSGLALGIDSIAHMEAVKMNTYTMAILGSGIDLIYPKSNLGLAQKIIEARGTILSPFPPGVEPMPYHFPRRNWLIAALSSGTIVIEGSEKSGAMITGKAALELGKPVVALMQDFRTPGGRGAIELVRNGACPVVSIDETLEAISMPQGGQMAFL